MTGFFKYCKVFILLFLATHVNAQQKPAKAFFTWQQLKEVPDADGYAGSFAGVSGNALLVAGGSNFPSNGRPWANGVKAWHDNIFALEQPGGNWKQVGKLPRPLGYGVSLAYKGNILCLGGGDAKQNYKEVFLLKYAAGKIITEYLPSLPVALINSCGVIINDAVYLAGGVETASPKETSNLFLKLDLLKPVNTRAWEILPSFPGESRMLAVAGALDGSFYLFGGVHLSVSAGDSIAHRTYLKDCWKYTLSTGWSRIEDMPSAYAGAPSPAYVAGQSNLLIFGGDDGINATKIQLLKDSHPGFHSEILLYNNITNSWTGIGDMPSDIKPDAETNPHGSTYAPVTTPLVIWNNNIVLAGGEARPAVRSKRVLMASAKLPDGKFGFLDWSVIALYFVAVVAITLWITRKAGSTTGDFFLGGQNIPWWAAGLSIFGAKLSALTFIAIPAKAYATDWVYIMNNVMIVVVAPIVAVYYLPYFRKLKLTSVYEYLQIRFNSKVKLLGSLTFVLFQLSRLGVVIYLPSLVLSTVTGIDIFICIFLTTIITTAYTVAGGIEAVVWTEVMQVFVLLGGALASFFFITTHTEGGFSGLVSEAYHNDKLRVANLGWSISEPVLWVVTIGAFLTQLITYTSDQVVVQRYLTTSSEKEARKSIYTNAFMVIPASLIFFGVGTALWFFFRHHPGEMNPHSRTDDVFPYFISQQLPAGLSGLVIAGLFAATMSTISSSMNSISTVITTDFYQYFNKGVSDKQSLRFAKGTTIVFGAMGSLIAVYLVYLHNASIWDQYLKIIGLFGGCLAGMFLAGIFFKRIHGTGIMIGFFISTILLYITQGYTTISFYLYPAVAIVGCTLFGYLFSILIPGKEKAIEMKSV